MKKIVYITVQAPFGKGETFILNEMVALKRLGADLLVIPRNPSKEVFHKDAAESVINYTLRIPLVNIEIVTNLLVFLLSNPFTGFKVIIDIIFNSGNLKTIIKNLAVLPKALYLAKILKGINISHIHAHWGTTTSTIAYIISELTGTPWSLTLHRGDINERNMLTAKAESARFVRCISEREKNRFLKIVGREYRDKVKVIHIGVDCDTVVQAPSGKREKCIIVTPAYLYPVKGHKYLIDACSILMDRGVKFKCYFYGDGFLRQELETRIEKEHLNEFIEMPGIIPYEELMEMYRAGKVDVVVLPSINTDDGTHEGIPVSLMEAMSYGIPVISTNTGSIPELIGDENGIMVREKDGEAIADAIESLILDESYYNWIGNRGRLKIVRDFNLRANAEKLRMLYAEMAQ